MSEVSQFIAQQLRDMGFPEVRIQKALKATSATSVETVMEWMIQHEDDSFDEESSDNGTLTLRPGTDPVAAVTDDDTAMPTPVVAAVEERPKTAEEVAEAKVRYDKLIIKRRQEREEKERLEEVERLKNQRKSGNEIVKLKEKVELDERIRAAEDRRREKVEDKVQRQKVLDQIKSDRDAFNARNSASQAAQATPSPVASVRSTPVSHDSCRLAIRLPDGSNITNTFLAKEQLAAVRLYVQLNRKDPLPPGTPVANFNLVMPPSTPFSEEDMERPLIDLGLCPSARLIVSQKK